MIPRGPQAIGHLITRIATDLMPQAPNAYAATDLGYFTILLSMVAQDYERAADVYVTEDAEISVILRKAVGVLEDRALQARIADALDSKAASLKLSDLTARSDTLLALLIEVHAAVEDAQAVGAGWAPALNSDIWRFLEAHVARRAYDVNF